MISAAESYKAKGFYIPKAMQWFSPLLGTEGDLEVSPLWTDIKAEQWAQVWSKNRWTNLNNPKCTELYISKENFWEADVSHNIHSKKNQAWENAGCIKCWMFLK